MMLNSTQLKDRHYLRKQEMRLTFERMNNALLHRQYQTRNLQDMALYSIVSNMRNDNGMPYINKSMKTLLKKLSPDILGPTTLTPYQKKKREQYHNRYNTRGNGVAYSKEEAKAYAFGHFVNKTLANNKLSSEHPLATKNPNDPVTQRMLKLKNKGYNYKGGKRLVLHRALQQHKDALKGFRIINDPQKMADLRKQRQKGALPRNEGDGLMMTSYNKDYSKWSKGNYAENIKKIKHHLKSQEARARHAFVYFGVDSKTYDDPYPSGKEAKKYWLESRQDAQPKEYGLVSAVSLNYQRKLGMSPEESLSQIASNMNGRTGNVMKKFTGVKPSSINLGLWQQFGGAFKRFKANRTAEAQSQKSHQNTKSIQHRSKQNEGPEF